MKKVLVLKGKTGNNVLTIAAEQIAEGFKARGYEVVQREFERCDGAALQAMSMPYSFLFSCQALGFEVELPGGIPLVQAIPNTYIGWIFDDVMYHGSRVKHACCENSYLLTVDQECVRAVQKMYPKVCHIGSLYHGGFCATGRGERAAEAAFWSQNRKDIDVLFSANLREKPELEKYMETASELEVFLAEKMVELLKKRPYLAIRTALELILGELGESLTGGVLHGLENMLVMIDRYIRWQSRYDVLEALLKAGIRVTVVGEGEVYEQLAEQYPEHLCLLGPKDILDVVSLMTRSKVVINPCAIYTEGLHERMLTAMLCKAVCFTPWSAYLESNFENCFRFIELDHLDAMVQEIPYILEHPETVERQLEENYAYAMEYHTWKRRGEEIIDFYESQIVPIKG